MGKSSSYAFFPRENTIIQTARASVPSGGNPSLLETNPATLAAKQHKLSESRSLVKYDG